MVKIGKFFKRKGGHNDGFDEKDGEVGSFMSKVMQVEKTGDVPVDAADNERSDGSARKSVSSEESEQREEGDEAPALSASESEEQLDASPFDDINTTDDIIQLNTVLSDKSFVTTAMEQQVTAKYFHKDVVVNCLEEGAHDLVIRAMYCIPKPNAEDHVVVKVEACTVSPRDVLNCQGHGITKTMLPYVPGYDIVGTIQLIGEDVNAEGSLRIGDRVAGVSTCGGGNSRFISIPANRLTKISTNVKSTHAVCLLHDYMAALKTLRLARKGGRMFTGMNILITDGFSPVGQAIIALASMEGAKLYCCADESKHPYLASLGVKCFDKNPEVWLPGVTNTFDIVIDNSCLDGYYSSWRALNTKGILICLGPIYNVHLNIQTPPSACGELDLTEMHQKWSALKAKYMMSKTYFLNTETTFEDDTEQYRQDLSYLMFLCARGDIIPKVAERVSLDDVPDAQRLLQIGKANGTVVCVPWIQE